MPDHDKRKEITASFHKLLKCQSKAMGLRQAVEDAGIEREEGEGGRFAVAENNRLCGLIEILHADDIGAFRSWMGSTGLGFNSKAPLEALSNQGRNARCHGSDPSAREWDDRLNDVLIHSESAETHPRASE